MDNCGSHKTSAVDQVFEERHVDVALLPKNMTSTLQVLDVAINGAIKDHIRKMRAEEICDDFKDFKQKYYAEAEKPIHLQQSLKFKLPKPSMDKRILQLIDLFATDFKLQDFADSIYRTFVKTGTLPDSDGNFVAYVGPTEGAGPTLPIVPPLTTFPLGVRRGADPSVHDGINANLDGEDEEADDGEEESYGTDSKVEESDGNDVYEYGFYTDKSDKVDDDPWDLFADDD